eukprot:GFKZ01010035.1.p1 GENE.GFKZ01010035.1~~GFKZ01010035.1.p1  ORF type:complete len:177 (+),score=29.26 GFKZ01010035.1:273-803(+)
MGVHICVVTVLALVTLCVAGRDYYSLLDVPPDAPKSVIKKSYRRLARLYHPDKHPGDKKMEQKFKDISEAYEVLSDEGKRNTYDNFGEEGLKGGGGGGGHGFHHGGFGGGGFRMEFDSSMFGDMFSGGGFGGGFGGFDDGFRRQRRHQRPPPRRQKVCFQNKLCENGRCFMVSECK